MAADATASRSCRPGRMAAAETVKSSRQLLLPSPDTPLRCPTRVTPFRTRLTPFLTHVTPPRGGGSTAAPSQALRGGRQAPPLLYRAALRLFRGSGTLLLRPSGGGALRRRGGTEARGTRIRRPPPAVRLRERCRRGDHLCNFRPRGATLGEEAYIRRGQAMCLTNARSRGTWARILAPPVILSWEERRPKARRGCWTTWCRA